MKFFKLLLLTIVLTLMGAEMIAQPLLPPCPRHPSCDNGGGSNADPIICHWPPSGNMSNKSSIFRWEPMTGATSYTVIIMDEDGEELHSMTTPNTAVILNLPNLSLKVGDTYIVQVESDNNKTSNNHEFTLKTELDYTQALVDLESDAQYQAKSGVDKAIRKSDFLNSRSWNLAAVQAHNIEVDNIADMTRLSEHFQQLTFKLFDFTP